MNDVETGNNFAYLASLCEMQGIKYKVEGSTFHIGAGTIVLPSNTAVFGNSTSTEFKLTPVASVICARN